MRGEGLDDLTAAAALTEVPHWFTPDEAGPVADPAVDLRRLRPLIYVRAAADLAAHGSNMAVLVAKPEPGHPGPALTMTAACVPPSGC